MIFLFYSTILCICTETVHAGKGFHHYSFETNDNDIICINITSVPLYILFYSYDENSIYRQYVMSSSGKSDYKITQTEIIYLKNLKYIQSLIDDVEIETPTGTTLSFTLVSVPGMCDGGFYFSTYPSNQISFSTFDPSEFYALGYLSDKCILFGSPDIQNITISFSSNSEENQLYVYKDFYNFESTPKDDYIKYTSTTDSPLLLRIICNSENPSVLASVQMETSIDLAYIQYENEFKPNKTESICKTDENWREINFLNIFLIALCVTLLFLIVRNFIYCYESKMRNENLDPNSIMFQSLRSGNGI